MIAPICQRCGKELTKPGGLAFSPPSRLDIAGQVTKLHLCDEDCWHAFLMWMSRG